MTIRLKWDSNPFHTFSLQQRLANSPHLLVHTEPSSSSLKATPVCQFIQHGGAADPKEAGWYTSWCSCLCGFSSVLLLKMYLLTAAAVGCIHNVLTIEIVILTIHPEKWLTYVSALNYIIASSKHETDSLTHREEYWFLGESSLKSVTTAKQ